NFPVEQGRVQLPGAVQRVQAAGERRLGVGKDRSVRRHGLAVLPAEPHQPVTAGRFAGTCEDDAMDCCGLGHTFAAQPWIWGTPLASVGAMLAGEVEPRGSTEAARTAETAAPALAVLRNSISVDVHSHGGKTGITSKAPPSSDLAG